MESFPVDFVQPVSPLLVFSGLRVLRTPSDSHSEATSTTDLKEDATKLTCNAPLVSGPDAIQIHDSMFAANTGFIASTTDAGNQVSKLGAFKIAFVGRNYTLPIRKARAPYSARSASPSSVTEAGSTASSRSSSSSRPKNIHSPLSPLTPSSDLYPDGIISPAWVAKHRDQLPSCFVVAFSLGAQTNGGPPDDLHLISEINNLRSSVFAYSPRIRFACVLFSNETSPAGVEGRLANIRRVTGLDLKSSLFLITSNMSYQSSLEFAQSFLAAVRPGCIEHYRDLSKHTRRKRNRGTIPPPTLPPTQGTSQVLSGQGWNARYEFKLGVFAEFRHEWEPAYRNFDAAYETLLKQDVLEAIAQWSPRWNEARLLADTIAIRMIRCLLSIGQQSVAVARWQRHRNIMRDLVDRRDKGSGTYSWEAWEATWAQVMASLLNEGHLLDLTPGSGSSEALPSPSGYIFSPQSKNSLIELREPWQLPHHPGYWYRLSLDHLRRRRDLAGQLTVEDTVSTTRYFAASSNASLGNQDTYLCPPSSTEALSVSDGGTDHMALIQETLSHAASEFEMRKQRRAVEQLRFTKGMEYMDKNEWLKALEVLRPLWGGLITREEGWWDLLGMINLAVRKCARRTRDAEMIIAVEWELLNSAFTKQPSEKLNLAACLNDIGQLQVRPSVVLRASEIASFICVSYAFQSAEARVGDMAVSQLSVSSTARPDSEAVTFSEITTAYEGNHKQVSLRHKPASDASAQSNADSELIEVSVEEEELSSDGSPPVSPSIVRKRPLVGYADLTFDANHTKVFQFRVLLRDAGEAKPMITTVSLTAPTFDVDYVTMLQETREEPQWRTQRANSVSGQRYGESLRTLRILPKPPRLRLELPSLLREYYSGENIQLDIGITNAEDEEAAVVISARFLDRGNEEVLPAPRWKLTDKEKTPLPSETEDVETALPARDIGHLPAGCHRVHSFAFSTAPDPAEYTIEIRATYRLLTDLESTLLKTLNVTIPTSRPFEANFDYHPRLHPDPWPNYFSVNVDSSASSSSTASLIIPQRWLMVAHVACFAVESLTIEDAKLIDMGISSKGRCKVISSPIIFPLDTSPQSLSDLNFQVDVAKDNIHTRGAMAVNLALELHWKRQASEIVNKLILPIQTLNACTPEPRVVVSAARCLGELGSMGATEVHYTILNPSMHVLTFGIEMDASEEVAFSGVKMGSVTVLPLGRCGGRVVVVPLVEGSENEAEERWVRVGLRIVDRYFGKILKIGAAERCRRNARGELEVRIDALEGEQ